MHSKNGRESTSSLVSNREQTKSTPEKNKYEQFNLSKKIKIENLDEIYQNKRSGSGSTDDQKYQEKYHEATKQFKEFYDEFKTYALNEDLKLKLDSIRNEKEDDPLVIVKYANHILKLLVNAKKEEESIKNKNSDGDYVNDYELLLQKAENDIRQHIRIEQQLKLLIETMQAKLEEFEKNKDTLSSHSKNLLKEAQNDNSKLIEMIKQKEQEVENMNKIIKQKNDTIKSFEERMMTITILEHKLKSLREKQQKEKDEMKSFYESEFSNLTKEIQHIHKVLSVNLANDEKIKLLHRELQSYREFNIKKVQHIESRLRDLDEIKEKGAQDEFGDIIIKTEPDMSDRRKSMRPSTSLGGLIKYKGYDLASHRHSTDVKNKSVLSSKGSHAQIINKKKAELINEVNVLSITRVKDLQQKQQKELAKKPTKEFDNYFKYFSNRLDTLQQLTEKEREQLRSMETRRSSSVKRGTNISTVPNVKKEKSFDKNAKENHFKTQEDSNPQTERLSYSNSSAMIKLRASPLLTKTTSQNKFKKF